MISIYYDMMQWAYNTFNYLNGKINNTKSIGMILIANSNCFGRSLFTKVELDLNNILRLADEKRVISTFFIKGFIVCVIAHELSHIDQCIDYKKILKIKKYADEIEAENQFRVLSYLLSFYDELVYNLGQFDINGALMSDEMNRLLCAYKDCNGKYKTFSKTDTILNIIKSCDIIKYKDIPPIENISNIILSTIDNPDISLKQNNIYLENNYQHIYEEMYNIKLSIDPSVYIKQNYIKSSNTLIINILKENINYNKTKDIIYRVI